MTFTTKLEIDLKHIIDEQTEKQVFPDTIIFYAAPMLEKDWRKRMTDHFALSEAEKKAREYEFHVALLLALAHKEPKGFPAFNQDNGMPSDADRGWKEKLAEYFKVESEIKYFLAKTIVDEHIAQTRRYSFQD